MAYSYSKMIVYANEYVDYHNDACRACDHGCTNFISKIMSAVGWKPVGGAIIQRTSNKDWFYGPTKVLTSYTWAGAENWYRFAIIDFGWFG